MKKCNKCGEEKEEEDFYKTKGYKDGVRSMCKLCVVADTGARAAKKYVLPKCRDCDSPVESKGCHRCADCRKYQRAKVSSKNYFKNKERIQKSKAAWYQAKKAKLI